MRKLIFRSAGWSEPHHLRVALRKSLARLLVIRKRLFESRACEPVAHSRRKFAQIQSLARGIEGAKQPLHSPPQVLRSNQQRLRGSRARLDQAYRRPHRQPREEILVTRGIEFLSAIQFQHTNRIQRGTGSTDTPVCAEFNTKTAAAGSKGTFLTGSFYERKAHEAITSR